MRYVLRTLLPASLFMVAACGGGSPTSPSSTSTTPVATAPAPAPTATPSVTMTLQATKLPGSANALNVRKAEINTELGFMLVARIVANILPANVSKLECRVTPPGRNEYLEDLYQRLVQYGVIPAQPTVVEQPIVFTYVPAQTGPVKVVCNLEANASGTRLTSTSELLVQEDLISVFRSICTPSASSVCLDDGLEVSGTFIAPDGREGTALVIPSSVTRTRASFYFTDIRQPEFSVEATGCSGSEATLNIRRVFTRAETPYVTRLRFRTIDLETFSGPAGFNDVRPCRLRDFKD